MTTALAADPICKEHHTGAGHPERPERFDAALHALDGLDLIRLDARLANEDEIALCHSRPYLRLVEREVTTGFHELSTGDTIISPRSFGCRAAAAGGALNAVDAVMSGQAKNAFCIVRPPGHHATAPRHGFLPLQQHRHRCALCAASATAPSASQSPTGMCITATARRTCSTRTLLCSSSARISIPGIRVRALPAETGEGAGKGLHAELSASGGFRPRGNPRCISAISSGPAWKIFARPRSGFRGLRFTQWRSAGPLSSHRRRLHRSHKSDARNRRQARGWAPGLASGRRL